MSTSDRWRSGTLPCRAGLEHGVEDEEELAHAGGQGDLRGFPCVPEALVAPLRDGVPSDSGEGGHVEHLANAGSPADGASFAARRPLSRIMGATPTGSDLDDLDRLAVDAVAEVQLRSDLDRWTGAFEVGVQGTGDVAERGDAC